MKAAPMNHARNRLASAWTVSLWVVACFSLRAESRAEGPLEVTGFLQPYHHRYGVEAGLPDGGVTTVTIGSDGRIHATATSGGVYRLEGDRWSQVPSQPGRDAAPPDDAQPPGEASSGHLPWYPSLASFGVSPDSIRDVARHAGEIAIAANEGLFVGDGTEWTLALPIQGSVRWAPVDVRGVAYDTQARLWFAAPQGVGCRLPDGQWQIFTGQEGLPFNDFTCIAAGPDCMWFGTTNGAVKFADGAWSFRQGGRWLLDDHVRDVVVDSEGSAWLATKGGISRISTKPMTLASKAAYYEQEIERHHRRTRFGYVNPALLSTPGDTSTSRPTYSDNDGFNTGLYLAANSLAYSVTDEPKYRDYAERAFLALEFLGDVTQGGRYAAPLGFVARNVVPIAEEDPNERFDLAYDIRRNERDSLWKIMRPRVPTDATGQWYWKCDSSSDELDGHLFGYAIYFDHVCATDEQKAPVRRRVREIVDHLLKHDYTMVDYDGRPTRWGHFSPRDLNRNPDWVAERGMNSFAMLTYLTIAHRITGDARYREACLRLAFDHGYGMNGMSQYKWIPGALSPGRQPGDHLSFMNYYHLLRYETDPTLLSMYSFAISRHWSFEKYERNAFTNFIYDACCRGRTRKDNWGDVDLSPPPECLADAVDTLERYPLDLIEWPMSNAHRIDMLPLEGRSRGEAVSGSGRDGYAFPIDERHETYWDWDPWKLRSAGDGTVLRPGFHYLLAYYLGRYHGAFVE